MSKKRPSAAVSQPQSAEKNSGPPLNTPSGAPLEFHSDGNGGGRYLTASGYDPEEDDLRERLTQMQERLAGIAYAESQDAQGLATGWPVLNQVYVDLRGIIEKGIKAILSQLKEFES